MSDSNTDALQLLQSAELALAAAPNDAGPARVAEIRAALAQVEAATPGGAPLHHQLDTVRKWLDALERPAEHAGFGGFAHLQQHVLRQLRLAVGALEDYQRAMG